MNTEAIDYWDRRPCNIRHSKKDVGTLAYFREVSDRRYFVEPHIRRFADFEAWNGKRVWEIGCGIGTDAAEFARNGAEYIGVDTSAKSVELAQRRFALEGLAGSFTAGNAEGNQPGDCDLVYSFGVIHHARNPKKLIETAREAISEQGEFRLMLYAANSWKAAMIDAGLDQPEAQSGCPIARTYTHEQAKALLEPHFTIADIRQDHIFPWRIADYVEHRYRREAWFEAMPPEVFTALKARTGWHLLITARPA